jgi:hypothetical protein
MANKKRNSILGGIPRRVWCDCSAIVVVFECCFSIVTCAVRVRCAWVRGLKFEIMYLYSIHHRTQRDGGNVQKISKVIGRWLSCVCDEMLTLIIHSESVTCSSLFAVCFSHRPALTFYNKSVGWGYETWLAAVIV